MYEEENPGELKVLFGTVQAQTSRMTTALDMILGQEMLGEGRFGHTPRRSARCGLAQGRRRAKK